MDGESASLSHKKLRDGLTFSPQIEYTKSQRESVTDRIRSTARRSVEAAAARGSRRVEAGLTNRSWRAQESWGRRRRRGEELERRTPVEDAGDRRSRSSISQEDGRSGSDAGARVPLLVRRYARVEAIPRLGNFAEPCVAEEAAAANLYVAGARQRCGTRQRTRRGFDLVSVATKDLGMCTYLPVFGPGLRKANMKVEGCSL
jgi:hypothetical protein